VMAVISILLSALTFGSLCRLVPAMYLLCRSGCVKSVGRPDGGQDEIDVPRSGDEAERTGISGFVPSTIRSREPAKRGPGSSQVS
jgi:hypothetical protein